jgi:hypothetical protein
VDEATRHLRALARRIVDAARAHVPIQAALLTGSGGRGDADLYSDLDLILYVDELPPNTALDEIRTALGGSRPIAREPTEHVSSEEFDLDGVRTEVSFVRLAGVEWLLDELLERHEELESPLPKVAVGIAEGLTLYGDDVVECWRRRLEAYPDGLRRAMVERYWRFMPLWYYSDAVDVRDAELWRLDMLLEAAFNLLGVLAGLNRLYFTRFELKRMRVFTGRMELAPADLPERLESLFRLPPRAAADELERLVDETGALVKAEFPDLELPLRFAVGARQQQWRV